MKRKGSIIRERLSLFPIEIAKFVDDLPGDIFHRHLSEQLIRASTSSYNNYGEADSASSARDFVHKLRISLKELNESINILDLIMKRGICKEYSTMQSLMAEANELSAMIYASIRTASKHLPPKRTTH